MRPEDEDRIAAQLARVMAVACVRNTQLETLHAGLTPVSRTGDGSDVIVEDAEGNAFLGPRSRGSMTTRCAR
jgi:hypothetical protein